MDMLIHTHSFDVYVERESSLSIRILDLVVEGGASILVVPAPAGGVVVIAGLALASVRRRR